MIIKEIKTWFTRSDSGETIANIQIPLVKASIEHIILRQIAPEVCQKIAEKWLEENGEILRKEIISNKKFADAVYNAIVLKKAKEFI